MSSEHDRSTIDPAYAVQQTPPSENMPWNLSMCLVADHSNLTQGFTVTEGSEYLSTYTDTMTDSGQGLERQFCKNCGSNMFNFTPLYDIVSVSAGVLDDFEDWRPSLEQYCIHRADYLSPAKGVAKRFHESINGEALKDDGEGEGQKNEGEEGS